MCSSDLNRTVLAALLLACAVASRAQAPFQPNPGSPERVYTLEESLRLARNDARLQSAEQDVIIEAMTRALDYAHDHGVTLVGALGNGHDDLVMGVRYCDDVARAGDDWRIVHRSVSLMWARGPLPRRAD